MKRTILFIFLLCTGLISGCSERKPSVAVSVYPVEYLVSRIAGEYVDCTNISENTLIQRVQIKSNYKDILKKSDVLFYIDGLEPYMQLYRDDIRKEDIDLQDLGARSAIYKFERYTTTLIDNKATGVATPYYESEEFKGVETYDNDPMLWMDPVIMTSMASDICDYLIYKYPEYQAIFLENYKQLELDLARLDADFQTIPDSKLTVSFVSMTPSFGTWQKSYGIKVYPVILSKYGALPNNEQLSEIKKRIRNDRVRYIAVEDNLPQDIQALQEQLIEELGLIPVVLDNISSLTASELESSKDYLSIMYENLKTLETIAE